MSLHANIMIADDDGHRAEEIGAQLRHEGNACTVVAGASEAVKLVETQEFDVLIVKLSMSGGKGAEVIGAASGSRIAPQIIAISDNSSPVEAVRAMQLGAFSYLQTPVNMLELKAMVERAAERTALEKDNVALRAELEHQYGFGTMIGSSPQMQRVYEMIRQIAPTNVTVLIHGATGTGKEIVAKTIHYNSMRSRNRFVPLNCAGLVETILESELFGHEKGSFTGATAQRIGLFEYSDHGTIFLDEIGDMPISSQVKLLRVLESGEITRVGSNQVIPIDARVIAATNQDLTEMVENGEFRRDLYYRLNVVSIKIPPLREREGDIALLTENFIGEFSELHSRRITGLSPEARRILYRYPWPGNVRELRNCVEHMVVVTVDDVLGDDDIPDYIMATISMPDQLAPASSMAGLPLGDIEKDHIRRTLELVDGNREKAAQMLGIGERTLYRKIEKYGLK